MSKNVTDYIDAILDKEAEQFTNDPEDSGGKTKWGITEPVARAYGFVEGIEYLTRLEAFRIYEERYWYGPMFSRIEAIYAPLAERLLDFGVLAGQTTSAKLLQRCLNVLNDGGAIYPDVKVDGVLGTISVQALKEYLYKRGAEGARLLVGMVVALQSAYLVDLAERRPKDERFEYGWQLNRAIGNLLGGK